MNIDEMPAGRELDALVAEKVIGWARVHQIESGDFCGVPPRGVPPYVESHPHYLYILPQYSADIESAWEIVTQMEARFSLDTSLTTGSFWYAGFEDRGDGTWQDEVVVRAHAPTAPLAICRAALEFVEAREARETSD